MTYRVIQWGSGNVGYHSPAKLGKDAAQIAGLPEACARGRSTLYINGVDPDFTGNAIPAVCTHEAGLISTLDLPYTPTTNILG